MSATQTSYLSDPDDFCRCCKGSGIEHEEGSRPGILCAVTCYQCGGSGLKSVRLTFSETTMEAAQ